MFMGSQADGLRPCYATPCQRHGDRTTTSPSESQPRHDPGRLARHDRLKERGVAAVEFALVLPLLLGVLLAVIELGLMLYDQAVITQASREGARAGIVLREPKPSDSEIRQVVINHTQGALMTLRGSSAPQVTVLQSSPAAFPNPLQVTVRYTFSGLAVAPLLGALDQPVVLSATTTMVNE